jgi:hypothetical protein
MENMKNLIVYISPAGNFNEEYSVLTRVQIDNSLSLGWKKEDFMLVTNFNYEYNGVKSIIVGLDNFCAVRPRSLKTSIVPNLIDLGIVEKGKLYWDHDLDAFQANVIEESELGLESFDLGLTDYGWRDRWCMGSYFFKESARDIFELLKIDIFKNIEDETVMMRLTGNNINKVNERSKRLNVTYNFGQRNTASNFKIATKPLKVLHFHPNRPGLMNTFKPLMSERMIEIFNHHGIK